ncbi:MAG: ABC transporter substrate-binding protein, partial [Chloroflexota bacterium]
EDVPWIACNWTLEPFIFEPLGVNGSKFRFHIMDGVKWHDGKSVTVEDIEFALNYSRNFPRLESVWQSVLWSQIVDPTTIDIYLNTTASNAYWLQDDLAAIATMFPKHIYEKAGSTTAKLWEISYQSWTGKPPPAEYPFMKALIGCGPYVFDYWNKTSGIVHLVKFQNYWIDGPLKLEITAPTQVDPDTAFEYTVDILNAGSINSETDEFATAIIDYIEIYEDDNLINVLAGPFAVEPFSHLKLEPCTNTRLNKGLHTLSFKLYAYGELYDQYTHLVYSTIKEDINSDFYVGVDDVFAVASAFGSQPPPFSGCERWNEHCDVNEDYYVGIDDIFQIASSFSWDP